MASGDESVQLFPSFPPNWCRYSNIVVLERCGMQPVFTRVKAYVCCLALDTLRNEVGYFARQNNFLSNDVAERSSPQADVVKIDSAPLFWDATPLLEAAEFGAFEPIRPQKGIHWSPHSIKNWFAFPRSQFNFLECNACWEQVNNVVVRSVEWPLAVDRCCWHWNEC